MKRSAKEKWRAAYGMARATASHEDEPHKIDPKYIDATEYAMGPEDWWKFRKPGRFLAMYRQKKKAIESGVFWYGFHPNRFNINCRCSVATI